MALPEGVDTLIIGAGVHGLSTAYHLALELKGRGAGDGRNILVVDKTGIGAGASGIACGVVRNNYYQPAMRELMAHSVGVWESDPQAFAYHPVGYMQISPECMCEDVAMIAQQQRDIGYESVFIEGAADSDTYMKNIFYDWRAKGITSVLHEQKGGYANNRKSLHGLAAKAESEGVQIVSGVTVTGFRSGDQSESIVAVETNRGEIACERVIIGVGPWIRSFWNMLGLPNTISIKNANGIMHDDIPMWHYRCLEEGTLGVDPNLQKTNDGKMAPVMHVDSDAPLTSDVDGSLITDELWGIYYKPDFNFGGVQGGAMPYEVDRPAGDVQVDPYGSESPEFVSGDDFAHMWCSALAFCQERFSGQIGRYKNKEASGGLGCFTPDSFPVIDLFRGNVTVIADSNHGYKMIGVGKLVASGLCDDPSALLEPFRFSRYEEGHLHPVSNSPFPWS